MPQNKATSRREFLTGRSVTRLLVDRARQGSTRVANGLFGADMQVSLVNDGPVTFWLEVNPRQ